MDALADMRLATTQVPVYEPMFTEYMILVHDEITPYVLMGGLRTSLLNLSNSFINVMRGDERAQGLF